MLEKKKVLCLVLLQGCIWKGLEEGPPTHPHLFPQTAMASLPSSSILFNLFMISATIYFSHKAYTGKLFKKTKFLNLFGIKTLPPKVKKKSPKRRKLQCSLPNSKG